ncbi:hypothetical protein FRC10_002088 [Ceratobasidium sp. 414]|nr:hypothetical protein FRC10_002088 [Ceratobasidium sp. 414]
MLLETMSFPEPVAGPAEYALHYNSNPCNLEHLWYGVWNHILTQRRDEADVALWIYPQYPLTQWGVTRAESTVLNFTGKSRIPPDFYDEASDEDPESPLKIKGEGGRSYKGRAATQDLFHIETRSNQTQQTTSKGPTELSLPSVLTTPEHPSGSQAREVPSSTKTSALDRDQDSYFTLDFAVVKILAPGLPSYNIFGYNVRQRGADIPIVLEAKKAPGRRTSPPGPNLQFQLELNQKLLAGYEDISLKVPVAFRCYPLQKSIIGIATSGLWWSFTVAVRGGRDVAWSMGFMYGNPEHDAILRTLFQAAAHSTGDPLEFQNGLIHQCLVMWERTTYNKHDALAGDRGQ